MGSFKNDLLSGVFWSAIEKYSGLIINLVVSMILARLLTPQEFGVVAVANVIISFLQMFCTMGIGPAIIYRDDLSQKDLDSIFTFSIIMGSFFTIIFACCSWKIARFYENQQLVPICLILCIQLFFASANMVPNALMAKHKLFKGIARRTVILQFISGFVSIIAALNNFGIYSLLIAPVFTSIGIFFWNRCYFHVSIVRCFTIEPIKRIFSYSSYQLLFEIVNYFSRNLDKLIIGKCLSVSELGYYEKSYRLMQQPLQYLTGVLNPVLQPVLNNFKNSKNDISCHYIGIIQKIAMISFPIGITLYFISPEIIILMFGYNWVASIPVLKILSLSLPLQMIQATSGAIFLVSNSTRAQFWVGIRNTITTVAGFVVAIYYWGTIESIAWAWDITLLINFIITYYILFYVILKRNVIILFKILVYPFFNLILLSLIAYFSEPIFEEVDVFLSLLGKLLIFCVITILFLQLTNQFNVFRHVRTFFCSKTNKIS